jgi:plastocyanin
MQRRMRYYGTIIVVALALLATTVAQAGDKPAETHTVLINGFAFVPDHLTVSAGDTVVWKNEDIVPHTATGKGVFDSQEIGSMKSWTYKTSRKGKFAYVCSYHPTMRAELTVQ